MGTDNFIRQSEMTDLPQILALYEEARIFMRYQGNPTQWGTNRPSQDRILQDIHERNSYVYEKDARILCVFVFLVGEEPSYGQIQEGRWLNDREYGVIHRIAASRETKGIARACMEWCYERHPNIRIDTHQDNIPMQRLLNRLGYERCGIIHVEDGSPRIAYQKAEDTERRTSCAEDIM